MTPAIIPVNVMQFKTKHTHSLIVVEGRKRIKTGERGKGKILIVLAVV